MQDEVALAGQAETPYGCVTKTLTIGEVAVPFTCPFALIFSLCDESSHFAAFLHKCHLRGSHIFERVAKPRGV